MIGRLMDVHAGRVLAGRGGVHNTNGTDACEVLVDQLHVNPFRRMLILCGVNAAKARRGRKDAYHGRSITPS
jgi:hypothetical protein